MKLVVDHKTVKASCPFGHNWLTTAKTYDMGEVKREGRRKHHEFETVYELPNCPECKIKVCRHIIDFECH